MIKEKGEMGNKCKFYRAWVGECGRENCEEHKNVLCSCGKRAIGECDEAISMVCGRYTCSENYICHYHKKPDSIVF